MNEQTAKLLEERRVPLAQLPTPIERLDRLSEQLDGPSILVKRDDQTGLALGGNKARKLEFLLADAMARGADTLVTMGAVQSNHCRQTAAAAARRGLACELVLNGQPTTPPAGNCLLDNLLGARLHFTTRDRRQQVAQEVVERLESEGKRPYLIGVGGSDGVGALGYVRALLELVSQLREQERSVDAILVATSSGGTQAGMVLGAKLAGFEGKIIGVGVGVSQGEDPPFEQEMTQIAGDAASVLGSETRVGPQDFDVRYEYADPGYGIVGAEERKAIELLARTEGLLLGPVYSCKTAIALVDLVNRGELLANQTVLFWHTGDTPTLFAHGETLTRR